MVLELYTKYSFVNTPAYLLDRLTAGKTTRIVAFGSSNTARLIPGMHWLDCLELACKALCGPDLVCINSGRGGDTTNDLLERIDRHCLAYEPHIAFITIGGNDSSPDRGVSPAAFRDNLLRIVCRIRDAGCRPVLQTYYAVDVEEMSPQHAAGFSEAMEAIRSIGNESGCMVVDHLKRWELLRLADPGIYRSLMKDAMHVNATGNLVLGLDIVRAFSPAQLPEDSYFHAARLAQALMDELGRTSPNGKEGFACR
jgi:lysophospholipase L1-like esterase